jgi:hypothetical protein
MPLRQTIAGSFDDRIESISLALALKLGWMHPTRHRPHTALAHAR